MFSGIRFLTRLTCIADDHCEEVLERRIGLTRGLGMIRKSTTDTTLASIRGMDQ
jgi:hypothetical protein